MSGNGFTVTEMVMVITVIAILAAIALPRMSGVNDLPSMTAADQLVAALQYAQTLAQRNGVVTSVAIANTQPNLTVSQNGSAVQMVLNQYPNGPSTGTYKVYFNPSVVVTPATTVTYDVDGIPAAAASFSVAMGSLSYTVTLTAAGHAYAN